MKSQSTDLPISVIPLFIIFLASSMEFSLNATMLTHPHTHGMDIELIKANIIMITNILSNNPNKD